LEAEAVVERADSSLSHPAKAPMAKLVSSGTIKRDEEIVISVNEQG
jgi:hypothetical protein